jgi:hypothetical protein
VSEISEPCYLFTKQPESLQWFKELLVTGPQISWDMIPRLSLYDLTAKVAVERESPGVEDVYSTRHGITCFMHKLLLLHWPLY